MPLRQKTLALAVDLRAAHEAREWIAAKLEELRRPELIDAAKLGVSELVSNAIIHGTPPMSVTLAGTANHPRIEVSDGSRKRPEPVPVASPDGVLDLDPEDLITVGRGLALVAMSSSAWGATIEEWGKIVWFEPVADPLDEPPEPNFHDVRLPGARRRHAREVPNERTVAVKIAAVPVALFRRSRRRYSDLRRELRLLSLAHQEHYPMAGSLTAAFVHFEQMIPMDVIRQVESAHAEGAEVTEVRAHISDAARPIFNQMLELLDLADEFCRAQRLLSLDRTPEQRAFQYWFFGELLHLAAGGEPTTWSWTEPDQTS